MAICQPRGVLPNRVHRGFPPVSDKLSARYAINRSLMRDENEFMNPCWASISEHRPNYPLTASSPFGYSPHSCFFGPIAAFAGI